MSYVTKCKITNFVVVPWLNIQLISVALLSAAVRCLLYDARVLSLPPFLKTFHPFFRADREGKYDDKTAYAKGISRHIGLSGCHGEPNNSWN